MEVFKVIGYILLLVAGFVLLVKGADVFVDGASKIAVKCNIPQMVVGLTIVALGTSAPEAAVSIKAAFAGVADMTVGNVVGSNILNILLILGMAVLFAPLPIKKNTLRIDIPIVVVVTLAMFFLGYFDGRLSRFDGVIMYIMLIAFITYLIVTAKKGGSDDDSIVLTEKDKTWRLILFILLGAALIVAGSELTVRSASFIAGQFGMSDRLISLTIVAFGTSLPELVTSCVAAKKGQADIAIGNIVGSNILNILFVAGTTMLISPVAFNKEFLMDSMVAVLAAVILFACCVKDKRLSRKEGIFMLIVYAVYFAYIMVKNYAA
jgi:cation:H+ antiporter